jgi:hypothetical protein
MCIFLYNIACSLRFSLALMPFVWIASSTSRFSCKDVRGFACWRQLRVPAVPSAACAACSIAVAHSSVVVFVAAPQWRFVAGASNIGYHCKERVVQLPALRLVHVNLSIQLAAHRACA